MRLHSLTVLRFLFWCVLFVAAWGTAPRALAAPDIPPELRPWVPWVLHDHPTAGCIQTPAEDTCTWAGELTIDVDGDGGSFRMRVWMDRPGRVALPGGAGQWPVEVRSDTGSATVSDDNGRPRLWLPAGGHVVSGQFHWDALPPSLWLPPETGTVWLHVDHTPVERPRVDAQGRLQLDSAGRSARSEGDSVELDVTRHITDDVPVKVRTTLALRVAGGARELALGTVLLDGTVPVGIESELPVRIGESQQDVTIQVRPGTWTVQIDALHDGPMASLTAPTPQLEAWPEAEFWSVATNDDVRSVTLGGGAGIDPARTPIDPALHVHPAYLLQPGDTLTFDEMRRGVPAPPPNAVAVDRTFWVDTDGSGITARDQLTGRMEQDWRLNVTEPLQLGHVSVDGTDQVVTTDDRGTGVEVRSANLSVVAESRLPSPWQSISAVGWNVNAQSLTARVHTPPGWTLLAVSGADTTYGTAASDWSLLDIFFVLVVVGAIGRLLGVRTAVLAVFALVLSVQDSRAPALMWLLVLGSGALDSWLHRKNKGSRPLRLSIRFGAVGLAAVLVLQLADYAASDLPSRWFPELYLGANPVGQNAQLVPGNTLGGHDNRFQDVMVQEEAGQTEWDRMPESKLQLGSLSRSDQRAKKKDSTKGLYQTLQMDPTAVVQTGPGIPTWSGSVATLQWSGRVSPDHTIRLWLLPPRPGRILVLLKFLLLGFLAFRATRLDRLWATHGRKWWAHGLPLLALLALSTAWSPSVARAAPSPELLRELEARLTAPGACEDGCVSVSRARVQVVDAGDDGVPTIRIRAEVHAVEDTGWAIPGPHTSWQPTAVSVDAGPTYALRRGSDGFLYVRVPAGVHTVQIDGSLADRDGLTLQFAQPPRAVQFDGPGFRMGGVRRDGTVDDTLQITRIQDRAGGSVARGSDNLSPWVTVRRSLDLGVPWRITTTVSREGPLSGPLSLEVPLVPGEAVTDARHDVRNGRVLASFDGTEREVTWTGTLAVTERVELVAPLNEPWTEEWMLACSPIFSCSATASSELAPVAHTADGKWQPVWRPWPGETLTLDIVRPESVAGQTVTIDSLQLVTAPRARESESTLRMSIRTSQGGQHPVQLAADSELLAVEVDGRTVPARLEDGRLDVPLQPGTHQVVARWTEPGGSGIWSRVASVDPGAPAVNAVITLDLDSSGSDWRWVLATLGPRHGAKALHLVRVLLWMGVAVLFGRFFGAPHIKAPFPTRAWALLLLGLSTLPAEAVVVVLTWTAALIVRGRRPPRDWGAHNLLQLAILGGIPIVGGILLWSIVGGLSGRPDLWIEGSAQPSALAWAVDRTEGQLPRPGALSFPAWSWRALVLAWSLWLVVAVVRRAPWFWQALGNGGWLRSRPPRPPSNPGAPPTGGGGGPSAMGTTDSPESHGSPTPAATVDGPVGQVSGLIDAPTAAPEALPDPSEEDTLFAADEALGPRDAETDEITADPDSWAPDEPSTLQDFGDTAPASPVHGGRSYMSLLGADRSFSGAAPAVDLPYNPDRHVEIEAPTHSDDAIFIPAVDADPADYLAATAPTSARSDDDAG